MSNGLMLSFSPAEADHYSNMPTVKMLSIGGERLTPPPPPPPPKNVLDHYLHHDLVMLPLLWWFFSSPGTNVLGEVLSYPRRRCRRRRWRRQFQVKVFFLI